MQIVDAVADDPLPAEALAQAAGFSVRRGSADGAPSGATITVRATASSVEVALAVAGTLARTLKLWTGEASEGVSIEAIEDAFMRYFDGESAIYQPVSSAICLR